MRARQKSSVVLMGLFILALVLTQSGCTSITSSKSMVDIQSEVNTRVVATLVSYGVQTQLAAAPVQNAAAATPTPVMVSASNPLLLQANTPTSPPVPTATTVPPSPTSPPSAPVIVTFVPTSPPVGGSLPTISAEINTNCRFGPSTMYGVDGYLLVGLTSYVYGKDSGGDWWYIENPNKTGHY